MEDKVRRAQTEALFREVNERIAASAARFESDTAAFVCECADAGCTHRIEASLDDYEDVRADGTHFILVPGHEEPDIERVVEQRRRYHIVEKIHHVVRETVTRLNPRTA